MRIVFNENSNWLNIKFIVLLLLISILKAPTKLMYTYLKGILKLSGKNGTSTNRKKFMNTFS